MDQVSLDLISEYAAEDADISFQLYETLSEKIKEYAKGDKRYGEKAEKYNDLNDVYKDARRKADAALEDLKEAGRLITHAGHWEALKQSLDKDKEQGRLLITKVTEAQSPTDN